MTTWIALIILALGAMLLILNESGVIAGIDTTTFGYVAIFSAIIVYLSGGIVGSYKGRADALVRDTIIWLALGLGIVALISSHGAGASFETLSTHPRRDFLLLLTRFLRLLLPVRYLFAGNAKIRH